MSLAPQFGPGRFGLVSGPASTATTETRSMTTASAADPGGQILHPHNPLMAFGVIAAVAFGLMAVSTSVRVGKTKASISIGDPK